MEKYFPVYALFLGLSLISCEKNEGYKNQKVHAEKLEYQFDWVAIADFAITTKALQILDSINAIDQNDLIKINSGRCVHNCLPKESFYKLFHLTQRLNKINYDVVWQTNALKYKLVQLF